MAKSTKSNEITPNVNRFQFFEDYSTTPQITILRNEHSYSWFWPSRRSAMEHM